MRERIVAIVLAVIMIASQFTPAVEALAADQANYGQPVKLEGEVSLPAESSESSSEGAVKASPVESNELSVEKVAAADSREADKLSSEGAAERSVLETFGQEEGEGNTPVEVANRARPEIKQGLKGLYLADRTIRQMDDQGNLMSNTIGKDQVEHLYIDKEVVGIPTNEFTNKRNVQSVTFVDWTIPGRSEGESMTKWIGKSTFRGTRIGTVKFPSNLTTIDNNAFGDIPTLKTVDFTNSPGIDLIGERAFARTGLTKVDMNPLTKDRIEMRNEAFADNKDLSVAILPQGLRTISRGLLKKTSLRSITINRQISEIHASAFPQTLVSITVSEGNRYFKIGSDYALYTIDGRKLVAYPASMSKDTFVLPDQVRQIGEDAFRGSDVRNFAVQIESKLTTIGAGAFEDAKGLERVDLRVARNLSSVGDRAFKNSGIEKLILGYQTYDWTRSMGTDVFALTSTKKTVDFLYQGGERVYGELFDRMLNTWGALVQQESYGLWAYEWWSKNSTPNAGIDYDNRKLTGLDRSTRYKVTVDGRDEFYTSTDNGEMPIQNNWGLKTIKISSMATRNGNNGTRESDPQSIQIGDMVRYNVVLDNKFQKTAAVGEQITLKAPKKSGQTFYYWTTTGIDIDLDQKYTETVTFTMPASNVTFFPEYSIGNYSPTPLPKTDYDRLKFTNLTPNTKFKIGENGNTDEVTTDSRGETDILKKWGGKKIGVALAAAGGKPESMPYPCDITPIYSVTKDGAVHTNSIKGKQITLTAQNRRGYTFQTWSVKGVSVGNLTSKTITFGMPANDVEANTVYKRNMPVPTAEADYDNMKLTGLDANAVYDVAVNGYSERISADSSGKMPILKKWSNKTITITAANTDTQIAGSSQNLLIAPIYTVTVDGTAYKDTIQGKGISLTAEDRSGQTFIEWVAQGLGNHVNLKNSTINFDMPGNDVTLKKVYKQNPDVPRAEADYSNMELTGLKASTKYKITEDNTTEETVTDPNGKIDIRKDWGGDTIEIASMETRTHIESEPQNLDIRTIYTVTVDGVKLRDAVEGTSITVTAKDKPDHTFRKWVVTGISGVDVRNKTITFPMSARDVTLIAQYTLNGTEPEAPTAGVDYDRMKLTGLTQTIQYKTTVDGASTVSYPDSNGEMSILKSWSNKTIQLAVAEVGDQPEGRPQDIQIQPIYSVRVDGQEHKITVEGKTISVTAEEKQGKKFIEWRPVGVGITNPKANTITFDMPANDVELTAVYKQNVSAPEARADYDKMKLTGLLSNIKYKIDVNGTSQELQSNTDGEVPISKSWGGSTIGIAVAETDTHAESTSQRLSISPIYTVTVNGKIHTNTIEGKSITVTAESKQGQSFTKWVQTGLDSDVADFTKAKVKFSMPRNDVTLVAAYTPDGTTPQPPQAPVVVEDYDKMKLTKLQPVTMYSVTVDGVPEEIMADSQGEMDILKAWGGKDIKIAVAAEGNKPEGVSRTITIKPVYTVTVDGALYKNTVQGKSISVTAEKREGYTFAQWAATGVELTGATKETITFEVLNKDVALTKTYNLNEGAEEAPEAPRAVADYDKMKLMKLQPSTRYNIVVDGMLEEVTASGYGDIDIRKEWGGKGIRITAASANGKPESKPQNFDLEPIYTVMVDGDMYKNSIPGQEIRVMAEERPGHTFSKWMGIGVSISGPAQEAITFEMPRNDVTLVADYTKNEGGPEIGEAPSARPNYDKMKLVGLQPSTKYKVTSNRISQDITTDNNGEMKILKGWSGKTIKIGVAPAGENPGSLQQTIKIQAIYTIMLDGVEYKHTVGGKHVSITADSKPGYAFKKWEVTGTDIQNLTMQTIEFSMPWNDVSLTATYTSTGVVAPAAPTARADYSDMKLKGLNASTNYRVTADGTVETITADGNGEMDIQKNWSGKSIKIAAAAVNGIPESAPQTINIETIYTVTVDGGVYKHSVGGNTIRVTAKDKPGHSFKSWSATGVTLPDLTAQTIEFSMPRNDVTLITNYIADGGTPEAPEAVADYDAMKLKRLSASTKYKITVDGREEELTSDADGTISLKKEWGGKSIKIAVAAVGGKPEGKPQTLIIDSIYTVTVDAQEYKISIAGKPVTVTAEDRPGQNFVRWKAQGIALSDDTAKTIEFTMPKNDVNLQKIYKTGVPTPTATVNYGTMQLIGLVPGAMYSIDGEDVAALSDGTVLLKKEWGGRPIEIIKKETETEMASAPQVLGIDRIYSITIGSTVVISVTGQSVTVTAPAAPDGQQFKEWMATGLNLGSNITKETVTFTMPSNDVILMPVYTKAEPPKPAMSFPDVKPGDWFFEAVNYVTSQGIMSGMADGTFAPASNMERAQFATTLYRMAGSPPVEYEARFPDVPPGQFYTNAVMWASATGIITGYGNGMFGVSDAITREQLVVMLYRYHQYKGGDVSGGADLNQFADAGQVSGFAREAMSWAVGNQIISGDQGNLNPHGSSSRAVVSTVIYRYNTQ